MKHEFSAALFIDGSNLYGSQYKLFGPDHYLDFSLFMNQVEKHLKITFKKIYFYASYSPKSKNSMSKEKKYLKNEAFFYKSVRETKKVIFFKGYRSPTSGKEKEVDVKLAVDMVDFAHRKKFDKFFLLSGDADFMQALHALKALHLSTAVISIENTIMYKALLFYKMYIIQFSTREIRLYKIRKKPFYVALAKEDVVKLI